MYKLGTYSPWEKGKMIATIPGGSAKIPCLEKFFFLGLQLQTHRPTGTKAHHRKTTEQTTPQSRHKKKHWSDFADFVKCRPRIQTQNTDQKQTRKRPRIQTEKDPEFRQKRGSYFS